MSARATRAARNDEARRLVRRVLVVPDPVALDVGALAILADAGAVRTAWQPHGRAVSRAAAMLGRAAVGALRAPRLAGRCLRSAGGRSGMARIARALSLVPAGGEVLYLPQPRVAGQVRPLLGAVPTVVTVPPGHVPVDDDPTADVLRAATVVHCFFEADRTDLVRAGCDAERIVVERAGFDPRRIPPAGSGVSRPGLRLVAAFSFDWRAAIDDLLVATHRLRAAGAAVHLDLYGAGPELDRVLFTILDLGLGDIVRVLPAQAPVALARQLGGAGAFVCPNLGGSLSFEALSAMAAGIPVVALEGGSATEVVRSGKDGSLVATDDVDALVGELSRLTPELSAELGANAARRVNELFDSGRQAGAFARILDRATGGP